MMSTYRCKLLSGLLLLNIGLAATQTVTSPPSSASSSAELVETISDCELEDQVQRCTAGGEDYFVEISSSQTDDLPSEYIDCHPHDADLFCISPNGGEVFVQRTDPSSTNENEEEEHSDHEGHDHSSHEGGEDHSDHEGEEALGAAESDDLDCHFHAGVEHCTGAGAAESESAVSCSRTDRDYDIPYRIGAVFIVLVTSAIGVYSPILLSRLNRFKLLQYVFLVLKQFGTGVIISTAFVHLYTHAELMFGNECLGELDYEATTGSIVVTGIIISFAIDYLAHRFVEWRRSKTGTDLPTTAARDGSSDTGSGTLTDDRNKIDVSAEQGARRSALNSGYSTKLDVIVLEAGIIFHSIIIGLTSVLADDSFFTTLLIVVVFHQFFEGIALGTRIADVPPPNPSRLSSSPAYPGYPHSQKHGTLSLTRKLLLALPYSLITPIGMAIGIGVIDTFNGNDRSTIIAIGTLNAISAGILIWVGVVEMLAKDWFHQDGELTRAGVGKVLLATFGGLIPGLIIMSVLGKWV